MKLKNQDFDLPALIYFFYYFLIKNRKISTMNDIYCNIDIFLYKHKTGVFSFLKYKL